MIEVYSICWNEEKMISFFLFHYEKFCDKIIIYDNGSTDRTLEILKSHPKVEIRYLDTQDTLNDLEMMKIFNTCWKNSTADYVIIVAIDEFVQISNSLELHEDVYSTIGYNMVALEFPKTQEEFDSITEGVPNEFYSKPIIFKPTIGEHLSIGNHQSNLKTCNSGIKLLHYCWMGIDFVLQKNNKYSKRMSEYNIKSGAGSFRFNNLETIYEFNNAVKNKTKVK